MSRFVSIELDTEFYHNFQFSMRWIDHCGSRRILRTSIARWAKHKMQYELRTRRCYLFLSKTTTHLRSCYYVAACAFNAILAQSLFVVLEKGCAGIALYRTNTKCVCARQFASSMQPRRLNWTTYVHVWHVRWHSNAGKKCARRNIET